MEVLPIRFLLIIYNWEAYGLIRLLRLFNTDLSLLAFPLDYDPAVILIWGFSFLLLGFLLRSLGFGLFCRNLGLLFVLHLMGRFDCLWLCFRGLLFGLWHLRFHIFDFIFVDFLRFVLNRLFDLRMPDLLVVLFYLSGILFRLLKSGLLEWLSIDGLLLWLLLFNFLLLGLLGLLDSLLLFLGRLLLFLLVGLPLFLTLLRFHVLVMLKILVSVVVLLLVVTSFNIHPVFPVVLVVSSQLH